MLLANLADHFPKESATCAYVMPSPVAGRVAHLGDSLADDQDRRLVPWMRGEADR